MATPAANLESCVAALDLIQEAVGEATNISSGMSNKFALVLKELQTSTAALELMMESIDNLANQYSKKKEEKPKAKEKIVIDAKEITDPLKKGLFDISNSFSQSSNEVLRFSTSLTQAIENIKPLKKIMMPPKERKPKEGKEKEFEIPKPEKIVVPSTIAQENADDLIRGVSYAVVENMDSIKNAFDEFAKSVKMNELQDSIEAATESVFKTKRIEKYGKNKSDIESEKKSIDQELIDGLAGMNDEIIKGINEESARLSEYFKKKSKDAEQLKADKKAEAERSYWKKQPAPDIMGPVQPGKRPGGPDEGYVEDSLMNPFEIIGFEFTDRFKSIAMSLVSGMAKATVSTAQAGANTMMNLPNIFSDLIGSVAKFVAALDPALMQQLQLVFSDLMATIGIGLRPIIQAAIPIIRMFANVLKPVMDALAPVMQELANALIEMAVPYIMLWAEAIFNLIPVIESLIPLFLDFADILTASMPVISFVLDMFARSLQLVIGVFYTLMAGIKTVIAAIIDAGAWLVSWISKSKSDAMKGAANAVRASADKSAEAAYKAFQKAVGPREKLDFGKRQDTTGMAAKQASYSGIADLGKNLMQAAFGSSAQEAALNTANNTKRIADKMDALVARMGGGPAQEKKMAGVRK